MTRIKHSLVFGATDTAKTFTCSENGVATILAITMPNFTTAVSAVITILDEDNVTLYTSAAQNDNGTRVLTGIAVPIDFGYKVTVTLNDVAGGSGGTATVKLYIENRK